MPSYVTTGSPHLLMMRDRVVLICLLQRRRGRHVSRIDLLVDLHPGVHLRHAVLVGVGRVLRVPVRSLALLELPQALLQSGGNQSLSHTSLE